MIGMSCYGPIGTGLGTEARWFWRERSRLGLERWLISPHPESEEIEEPEGVVGESIFRMQKRRDWPVVERFLEGLHTVLFFERPFPETLPELCKARGIRIVCVVHPEWFPGNLGWESCCDCFVALNRFGVEHLERVGIPGSKVREIGLPVCQEEFQPRVRREVRTVVFCNGGGGVHQRKGWPEVRELLERDPGLVSVRSQVELTDAPDGVVVGSQVARGSDLYRGADLVVVPSRFGAIELTILEAMASGVLVMATDAPPMSEPIRGAYGSKAGAMLLPVGDDLPVNIWGRVWRSKLVDIPAMWEGLQVAKGFPMSTVMHYSLWGMEYIRDNHGQLQLDQFREVLECKS